MPSPQSLVVFMLTLFILLLATRTQLGLSPVAAAATSLVLALGLAWIVDRRIPPDEDEEADVTNDVSDSTADGRQRE